MKRFISYFKGSIAIGYLAGHDLTNETDMFCLTVHGKEFRAKMGFIEGFFIRRFIKRLFNQIDL